MVPKEFTAACAYLNECPKIDFDHFTATLTGIVGPEGHHVSVTHRTDEALLILAVGECHIKLTIGARPLAMEGFKNALTSPFIAVQPIDFEKFLSEHKEHVLITAGSGNGILAGDNLDVAAAMGLDLGVGEKETQKQLEFRLQILHMAVLYFCSFAKPTVIHWTQSEQLFTGDSYLNFINDELPLPVVMHPLLAPGDEEDELRAEILGSIEMLGRSLSIESTPLGPADLFQVALVFTEYCRQIKAIPGAGETFGRKEEWIGVVEEIPPNDFLPDGEISLSIISHKKFGDDPKQIKPKPRPQVTRVVPEVGDVNLRDQIFAKRSGLGMASGVIDVIKENKIARYGAIAAVLLMIALIVL